MSAKAAFLFAWLQDAKFYRSMHLEAARMLPEGAGHTRLDVGCGPGLLTRIAAGRGYAARGIDRDPEMIRAARHLAATEGKDTAEFEVSDLGEEADRRNLYDVVSASSLLVVLQDPAAALQQLIALAKPNGSIVIVEVSSKMTRTRAFRTILGGKLGNRAYMLQLWAMARAGRTLPDAVIDATGLKVTRQPLLKGMAQAVRLLRRP